MFGGSRKPKRTPEQMERDRGRLIVSTVIALQILLAALAVAFRQIAPEDAESNSVYWMVGSLIFAPALWWGFPWARWLYVAGLAAIALMAWQGILRSEDEAASAFIGGCFFMIPAGLLALDPGVTLFMDRRKRPSEPTE